MYYFNFSRQNNYDLQDGRLTFCIETSELHMSPGFYCLDYTSIDNQSVVIMAQDSSLLLQQFHSPNQSIDFLWNNSRKVRLFQTSIKFNDFNNKILRFILCLLRTRYALYFSDQLIQLIFYLKYQEYRRIWTSYDISIWEI